MWRAIAQPTLSLMSVHKHGSNYVSSLYTDSEELSSSSARALRVGKVVSDEDWDRDRKGHAFNSFGDMFELLDASREGCAEGKSRQRIHMRRQTDALSVAGDHVTSDKLAESRLESEDTERLYSSGCSLPRRVASGEEGCQIAGNRFGRANARESSHEGMPGRQAAWTSAAEPAPNLKPLRPRCSC